MATERKIKVELNVLRNDGRRAVLELETSKGYRGGVQSEAQVGWCDGRGSREIALGLGGGGDYRRIVLKMDGKATQANIDRCHAQAFTPEIIAEVSEQAKGWSQSIADRAQRQAEERNARNAYPPVSDGFTHQADEDIADQEYCERAAGRA